MLSLFRNGASSFLALSLLTSSAAGEIFEALNAVPNGELAMLLCVVPKRH
jgi:hypothetical protein